jgi:hypothetical protein
MTHEQFLKLALNYQKQRQMIGNAYKTGVDLSEFCDSYETCISVLIEHAFGNAGLNWWNWYCHETDFGTKSYTDSDGKPTWGAHDADGNLICYSWDSLFDELQKSIPNK